MFWLIGSFTNFYFFFTCLAPDKNINVYAGANYPKKFLPTNGA